MTDLEDHGLPLTALAVAAGRAVETSRTDPLIEDPFAAALVEAAHSHVDLPTAWPARPDDAPPFQQPLLLASIYLGMRTRFIDDFLTSDPQTAQAVVLGSGLDTRAYRLPWPAGARVIEIDHPNVLEFKASVMAGLSAEPACELISVATDLSRPWRELLARADPPDPVELLESAGWRCSEHTVAELCSLYGRSLSLTGTVTGTAASGSEPMGESGPSRGGFVTAWRQ